MADLARCPYAGCGYPVGECSGACLTPRAGFGAAPLPVDVVHPDPAVGDPVPRHLLMRSVEWHAPVGPVLRLERPPACPPCTQTCRQGRRCPARPVPAPVPARVPPAAAARAHARQVARLLRAELMLDCLAFLAVVAVATACAVLLSVA